jgi:hypothetical protein
MNATRIAQALAFAWLSLSTVSLAQTGDWAADSTAPQSDLPDPEALSGWIRVEVAVAADLSESALLEEQWPLLTTVRYPALWRWLIDLEEPGRLNTTYGETDVSVDDYGAVTAAVLPPKRAPSVTERAIDILALLAELDLDLDHLRRTSSDGDTSETVVRAYGLEDAPQSSSSLEDTGDPLLNFIGQDQDDGDIASDLYEEFTASVSYPSDVESALDQQGEEEPIETEAPPRPLPTAFQQRALDLLAEGLRGYLRRSGDALFYEAAWVQPEGAENRPIILDRSGDDAVWPAVQGFVELRRGSALKLGINLWANTSGTYLPDNFQHPAPPRAPQRLALTFPEPVLDPLTAEVDVNALNLGLTRDAQIDFSGFLEEDSSAALMTTSIEGDPFALAETIASTVDIGLEDAAEDPWPFRHLIHVADTREIRENYVRYFDHPVIKVLATWRELTWAEVWTLGEADQKLLTRPEDSIDTVSATLK